MKQVIALAVGVSVAMIAMWVFYEVALTKGFAAVVAAGEGSKVYYVTTIAGLLFGGTAYRLTKSALTRRDRRKAEAARLPEAKLRR